MSCLINNNTGRHSSKLRIAPFPLVLTAIVAVTAIPLGFRSPSLDLLYTRWNWTDILGNLLLYLPLGLFTTSSVKRTILLALALSTCAETVQFVSPGRFPGVLDIVSNVFGAALGSLLSVGLRRQGWNPSVFRLHKPAGWVLLFAGGLCAAALTPVPIAGDFSNWDPGCRLAFGDELNGNRRWRGEVLEAEIIPAVAGPDLVRRLARDGVGSIRRQQPSFPAGSVFELPEPVVTTEAALVLQPSDSVRMFNQITQRNRLSILLWIRTADPVQKGPARIITYSRDERQRNFLIGQEHRQIIFRLRTPGTGLNGSEPETETRPLLEADRDTFVVATYDGQYSRIYVNGELAAEFDLLIKRTVAGVGSLGLAVAAGAFLFVGLLILPPFRSRRKWAALVVAALGIALILSVPRNSYPGLSPRLVFVFLLGILGGHAASRHKIDDLRM